MAQLNNEGLKNLRQFIPVFVVCIAISVIVLIPLRVMQYGHIPADDALRHVGKVISGKDWSEILVLRSDIKMDSHLGWHAMLTGIYRLTGWSKDALVSFSIVSLFILFCLVPLLFLRNSEAWLMALMLVVLADRFIVVRLFFGRPFIFTMTVVMALYFLWTQFRGKKNHYAAMALIAGLTAASTWIHGSWYLFALPLASFFFAREWRAGIRISISVLAGILIGAALTGSPYLFLKEAISHAFHVLNSHTLQRTLAFELKPFTGNVLMVIAILGMLAWRRMRGSWDIKRIDNPVFIFIVLTWILGFKSQRVWLEWGLPAVFVWMAQEFQQALDSKMNFLSWKRLVLAVAVGTTLYLAVTNDANNVWTRDLTREYLSPDVPEHASWLPEPGGIIYSDDMRVFYSTFYTNPHAPWRYILGFESAMMPPEDLAIYRKIQWNFGAPESFKPWVEKMKPEDRLIINGHSGAYPQIPGLEWNYTASGTWIGRLPRE